MTSRFEVWTDASGSPAPAGASADRTALADALTRDPAVTRVWVLDRRDRMKCVYARRRRLNSPVGVATMAAVT